ncbi:MAG: hypothetical protein NXI11_00845 [Proteobacteria bacterium]|nr:hypothetical protein [Pseudomonadota bacterium]
MANPYRQFLRLLPRRPLLVGEITATNSDGTVDVTLPDGKVVRVRGSGTVGDRVFVQDGEVRGPAPNLPTFSVSV